MLFRTRLAVLIVFSTVSGLCLAQGTKPSGNPGLVPVYDIYAPDVSPLNGSVAAFPRAYVVSGRFWFAGVFAGNWQARPDGQPQIYVSDSAEFDPNGKWWPINTPMVPHAVSNNGPSFVDFSFTLPQDLPTKPTGEFGLIAVTLRGTIHGREETSIAAAPLRTGASKTGGNLVNSIVPISFWDRAPRFEIGCAFDNQDELIRRSEANIYLNDPWVTWKPWMIDSRPSAYVLINGPAELGNGIWSCADLHMNPDLGVWIQPARPDAIVRFLRPTDGPTSAMFVCHDQSYIYLPSDAPSPPAPLSSTPVQAYSIDQYSGLITAIATDQLCSAPSLPAVVPPGNSLVIIIRDGDQRLQSYRPSVANIGVLGLDNSSQIGPALDTLIQNGKGGTFDRIEIICHGNPYTISDIDETKIGPLALQLQKLLTPSGYVILTSCNSGVNVNPPPIAAVLAATINHNVYGAKGYASVGSYLDGSIGVNSHDLEMDPITHAINGGIGVDTYAYGTDCAAGCFAANAYNGYCGNTKVLNIQFSPTLNLAIFGPSDVDQIRSFLQYTLESQIQTPSYTLVSPDVVIVVPPNTPGLNPGTYATYCNGRVVHAVTDRGKTSAWFNPPTPYSQLESVKRFWVPQEVIN